MYNTCGDCQVPQSTNVEDASLVIRSPDVLQNCYAAVIKHGALVSKLGKENMLGSMMPPICQCQMRHTTARCSWKGSKVRTITGVAAL